MTMEKQVFLYITGGRVDGTHFNLGNLILSINITSAHTLHPSASVSKNLSDRETYMCRMTCKSLLALLLPPAKVENNLNVHH